MILDGERGMLWLVVGGEELWNGHQDRLDKVPGSADLLYNVGGQGLRGQPPQTPFFSQNCKAQGTLSKKETRQAGVAWRVRLPIYRTSAAIQTSALAAGSAGAAGCCGCGYAFEKTSQDHPFHALIDDQSIRCGARSGIGRWTENDR